MRFDIECDNLVVLRRSVKLVDSVGCRRKVDFGWKRIRSFREVFWGLKVRSS